MIVEHVFPPPWLDKFRDDDCNEVFRMLFFCTVNKVQDGLEQLSEGRINDFQAWRFQTGFPGWTLHLFSPQISQGFIILVRCARDLARGMAVMALDRQ